MKKNIMLAVTVAVILAMMPRQASAINKLTPLYMFGFAMSFNDSTVYLTEIQQIDSAWIDSRSHFLYSRENYSAQLQSHLQESGTAFPTAIVVFAEKRKSIEKKFLKFKKRYTSPKRNYILKNIAPTEFSFTHVTPDTPEARYTAEELKAAIKKEKAELKAARKAGKAKAKADKKEKKVARAKAMAEAKQRARELKKR